MDPRADTMNRKDNEEPLDSTFAALYKKGVGIVRFIVDTVAYEGVYTASQLAKHLHGPSKRHLSALFRLA